MFFKYSIYTFSSLLSFVKCYNILDNLELCGIHSLATSSWVIIASREMCEDVCVWISFGKNFVYISRLCLRPNLFISLSSSPS